MLITYTPKVLVRKGLSYITKQEDYFCSTLCHFLSANDHHKIGDCKLYGVGLTFDENGGGEVVQWYACEMCIDAVLSEFK